MTPNPLYHVEVTITRLIIEGEYKGNCLFAGLAIYRGIREDLLFCSNRSFWNSNTRDSIKNTNHTISPIDDMSLVLYSIEKYTSVSVSLILTLSNCTGVIINPCEYEAYCSGSSLNLKICKEYLKSLTTCHVQLKVKSQHFKNFQSLHKVALVNLSSSLLLTLKTHSCVQLYLSSFVKARKRNITEKWYHQYFFEGVCALSITPDIDSSKSSKGNWALYASSVGKINRLETFHIFGLGKIIFYQLEKYMLKKEKNTKILIEEKDFNTEYKVLLHYDIKFEIVVLSGIGYHKGTKLKQIYLGFQGGSNSTVLISLVVGHLAMLKESGLLSTLTSWEMFNIISWNYILPLVKIGTTDKTKQLLDILTKLNSAVYGYSMNINITGSSLHSLINNFLVANLKIETKFCITKCLVYDKERQKIFDSTNCQTLVASDISDTKGLFEKIYDNHCKNQSTLDWSMDLFTSNFLQSQNLKIQLPGIYEKAELYIYYNNHSMDAKEDQFIITLQDERIMKIVNSSLLLNNKIYYIFPETINKPTVYSWKEAEKLCSQYESHLPIFSSQSDVQDLVDIILRAAWTGPIRMIFIGLRVSKDMFLIITIFSVINQL